LAELQKENYITLNGGSTTVRSFWTIRYRQQGYVLLDWPAEVRIGRSSACQIVIGEASVSRVHARIIWEGGGWRVGDGAEGRASSNGIWLRVRRAPIVGESVVKVGDVVVGVCVRE
jgi:pSer/pThr/pTyr-binding forkhead associated (FHA) protein